MRRLSLLIFVVGLSVAIACTLRAEKNDKTKPESAAVGRIDLAGDWQLLLPAGFEHAVKLTPQADGYRLQTAGIATSGQYVLRGEQLVYIGDDDRQRFEWLIRSPYLLTLGNHDAANGADYTGAVLFRLSPAAKLRLNREARLEPNRHAIPPQAANAHAESTELTVEELNAVVKAGQYTKVREMMIGRELSGTAVVETVAPWGNISLNVRLEPDELWTASLFGWTNFEELQAGDRVIFRGLVTEESYANFAIWVSSWSKASVDE